MRLARGKHHKTRPGNRAMTKAEAAHVVACKTTACVPCWVWAHAGNMPVEDIATCAGYDHSVRGRIRRGHLLGFASCDWHHQGYPGEGWMVGRMRAHYGPSLMDGSRLFREAYGTDDELIALQKTILTGETV